MTDIAIKSDAWIARNLPLEALLGVLVVLGYGAVSLVAPKTGHFGYAFAYFGLAFVPVIGVVTSIKRLRYSSAAEATSWKLLVPAWALCVIGYTDAGVGYMTSSFVPPRAPQLSVTTLGLGVLLIAVALFRLPGSGLRIQSKAAAVVDSIIFFGSILIPAWIFEFNDGHLIAHEPINQLTIAVSPILIIAGFLTVLVHVINNLPGHRKMLPVLLLVGLVVFIPADFLASFALIHNWVWLTPASLTGYLAFFVMVILISRLAPSVTSNRTSPSATNNAVRFMLPYVFCIPAICMGLAEWVRSPRRFSFLIVATFILLAALVVRQVLVLFENRRLHTVLAQRDAVLIDSAFRDPLTGLNNRLIFDPTLEGRFRERPDVEPAAVMMIDLDRFKAINDTRGHGVGDKLLKAVGDRLQRVVREGDTVARLGGDEFAIVFDEPIPSGELVLIAGRMVSAITSPFIIDDVEVTVGTSVGIALPQVGHTSKDLLLRNADIALYAAKRSGGNSYRLYDDTLRAGYMGRVDVEGELIQALDRNQFFVAYQPIVDVKTNRPTGVEALLRWDHPERGILTAGEFISAAEESGMIVPIGKWALSECLRQAHAWKSSLQYDDNFFISINISARQLVADDLTETFKRTISESGIDVRSIRVELPESHLMASDELIEVTKSLGVSLILDDFGTGYSSLSYLRRLPVGSLKIGRSFIGNLGRSQSESVIVDAIIKLAHALRLTVIAEGVETAEQLEELSQRDCDFTQGYFCGDAMTAPNLEAWWARASI